jgi:hypothetical protein
MALRKCSRCGWKDESEFNLRDAKKRILQSICRGCQRELGRTRYANNKKNVLEINRQSKQKAQVRAAIFIQEYLSSRYCVDCGESDMAVLTFDHVKGEKKYYISDMVTGGYGIETIKGELEKTETVCFNCHIRRERRRRQ